MIVYVSIGNSDDKLSQKRWSSFITFIDTQLQEGVVHGVWFSAPDSMYQNACWCVEFDDSTEGVRDMARVKDSLTRTARSYGQDSIAWAEVDRTRFLGKEED